MARPSDFTQETADRICAELADGKSLRTVCKDADMPGLSTVFQWLRAHPKFAEQYARARDDAADAFAEDMLAIAEEPPLMTVNKAGNPVVDSGGEQMRRTRIDTRKWIASKLKPKKYGDKLSTELSGPEGGPIPHRVELVSLDKPEKGE